MHSENITEHFTKREMACKCGCNKIEYDPKLLVKLEIVRDMLGGVPIIINSGYRCVKHNKDVGGVPDSQHLKGKAADIRINGNMEELYYFLDIVFKKNGLGRYENFFHVDTGPRKRFTGKY